MQDNQSTAAPPKDDLPDLDRLAEELDDIPVVAPSMKEMSSVASLAQDALTKAARLEDEMQSSQPGPSTRQSASNSQQPKSMLAALEQTESLEKIPEADPPYVESFASQQETSELREQMEDLQAKIKGMEETITALLAERKAIPVHVDKVKEELNRALTVMNGKLQASLEANLQPMAIQGAITTLTAASDAASDVLTATSSFARAPPSAANPLSDSSSRLKGRRAYKAVR